MGGPLHIWEEYSRLRVQASSAPEYLATDWDAFGSVLSDLLDARYGDGALRRDVQATRRRIAVRLYERKGGPCESSEPSRSG